MSVDARDPREALFNLASCVFMSSAALPPWRAIKGWIPDDEPDPDGFDHGPIWQAPEIQLGDGRTLVLEYT